MNKVFITGSGVYAPPYRISNQELVDSYNAYAEKNHLEYSDVNFIVKASGIESRYVIEKEGILNPDIMHPIIAERSDEQISVQAEFALPSARLAMLAAEKSADEIDAVLVSCSNMQRAYPAMAIEIQQALGIQGFALDMNVACSSATFALATAASYIQSGLARCVLILNPEICTAHNNFRNRDCHFIFGDVSTAIIVEKAHNNLPADSYEIVSHKLCTHFSNHIRNNAGFMNRLEPQNDTKPEKLFYQEGKKVFKEVIPQVLDILNQHLIETQISVQQLQRLWLHQANAHMNRLITEKLLNTDITQNNAPLVLHEYANTASAGSVIAFDKYKRDLKVGDYGLLSSFGAGYSIGSVILQKVS